MKRRAKSAPVNRARARALPNPAAGAASVDITPPLEVGLLTSSVHGRWEPFRSVRSPLKARALVLECAGEHVALIALDLLALHSKSVGGWMRFKKALAEATEGLVDAGHIVLACTHTHNAPESSGVTNLYRTAAFQSWVKELTEKLALAIRQAFAARRQCFMELSVTELLGHSLQRRVPSNGRIVMSDSLQPITPELMEREPVDRRVHALRFRASGGEPIATLVHAICHPVHEMCLPHVSPDFPGELCSALERSSGGLPIFFNGAAGDVNPPTVSCGPDSAWRHGTALAKAVMTAGQGRRIGLSPFAFMSREIRLPARSANGAAARALVRSRLAALRLGSLAVLFLPGEIFVETARRIESQSPFGQTLIIGFAENSIGYVPTRQAFREGGYEIGPGKWSFLQSSAEPLIQREAKSLLKELFRADPLGAG